MSLELLISIPSLFYKKNRLILSIKYKMWRRLRGKKFTLYLTLSQVVIVNSNSRQQL